MAAPTSFPIEKMPFSESGQYDAEKNMNAVLEEGNNEKASDGLTGVKLDADIQVEPRSKLSSTVLLAALSILLAMVAINVAMLNPTLSTICAELNTSVNEKWINRVYLLAHGTAALWGNLSDTRGRRLVLLLSTLVYIASSAICALAENMTTFLIGRSFQGAGAAGILIMIFMVAQLIFGDRYRILFVIWFNGVLIISVCSGPDFATRWTSVTDWRWRFWINIPVAVASIILLFPFLDHPKPGANDTDPDESSELSLRQWVGIFGMLIFVVFGAEYYGRFMAWLMIRVIDYFIGC